LKNYIDKIKQQPKIISLFIIVFYCVGIIGFILPLTHILFVKLIPLALLLSFVLLYFFHNTAITKKELWVFGVIYIIAFAIESVGVNTGLIFGDYTYGSGLGIKLFNTPLLIGLNWIFMVYTSASIVNSTKIPNWLKVVLASFIMIAYDVFLEQMAPQLDMWHWSNGEIPLQNYIAWFILALLFHSLLKIGRINLKNSIAGVLLICQFLFFVVLLLAVNLKL
jgi:uncharacterized membrane protein